MLTSLSFLSAQRKSAPHYSPETREQPVALLAQPTSNERPLLEGEPLSLCSDLLRFSVAIPTVSSEEQKSKVFRDTPRSLCRRFLLFTEVRGIGILGSSPSRSSKKFGHEKSPRGNLSVGEDIPPDRTIRLRRERGREPTEGLPGGTTGAPRNDTHGPQRLHAKQGCWVGRRFTYPSDAHSGHSPLDHGCGAWRVLLALAGQDLHRLVSDRPLSGGGAQPGRKLAPAPPQAHEASPRHRAHIPGSIGGAAVGGRDLRACAHRPDKWLHQIRHHRGQRPQGAH